MDNPEALDIDAAVLAQFRDGWVKRAAVISGALAQLGLSPEEPVGLMRTSAGTIVGRALDRLIANGRIKDDTTPSVSRQRAITRHRGLRLSHNPVNHH